MIRSVFFTFAQGGLYRVRVVPKKIVYTFFTKLSNYKKINFGLEIKEIHFEIMVSIKPDRINMRLLFSTVLLTHLNFYLEICGTSQKLYLVFLKLYRRRKHLDR